MKFTGFQRSIVWIQGFQAPQDKILIQDKICNPTV